MRYSIAYRQRSLNVINPIGPHPHCPIFGNSVRSPTPNSLYYSTLPNDPLQGPC